MGSLLKLMYDENNVLGSMGSWSHVITIEAIASKTLRSLNMVEYQIKLKLVSK